MAKKKTYRKKRGKKQTVFSSKKETLALIGNLVPTITGAISVSIKPRSLSKFIGGPASQAGLNNYQKFKDIYDEFRPTGVLIQYITLMNTSFLASSGNPGTTILPQCVLVFDPDNITMSDPNIMLSQKGARLVNMNRNWKHYFKIPNYQNTGSTRGWSNLQTEDQASAQVGGIFMQSINPMVPVSQQAIGLLRVRWYGEFKGRNDSNVKAYFGVDDVGNTITVEPTGGFLAPNLNYDGDYNNVSMF